MKKLLGGAGVIITIFVLGGIYTVFFVDTSIQKPTDVFDLPADEIVVDTNDLPNAFPEEKESALGDIALKSGVITPSDWRDFPTVEMTTSVIVDSIDAPRAFTFLPGGSILFTERFGTLQLFTDGEVTTITGLPEVYAGGQGGMLDVIAHPDYEENNIIYLSYVSGLEASNYVTIARAELTEARLENLEVVFEVEQKKEGTSHFGSRFTWLPDTTLVFSIGDGGNPPISYDGKLIREQAQNLSAHLGKIIRIQDDGTIPQDNPFRDNSEIKPEIYSYGHRNVQGVAYDPVHDYLIASEHGSKGGDELNVIYAGKNYGWPRVSYATEYDIAGTLITPYQSRPEFVDPIAVWTPTIAPSALFSYTGDLYPERKGDIFLAAMLIRSNNSIGAYASSPAGAILRIDRDDEGNIIEQERIYIGDVRVRSIAQGPDGKIYALTDDTGRQQTPGKRAGKIVELKP